MSNRESITPDTMKLNELEPDGFCNEPRSLFHEVTKLREAVLRLCDLMGELDRKVTSTIEQEGQRGPQI
jgi:hypothetical protein